MLRQMRIILAVAMSLAALSLSAADFQADGINYVIRTGNTVMVVAHDDESGGFSFDNGYEGDLVIPSQVEYEGQTYTVTTLDDYVFMGASLLTSVTLPATLTTLGESPFAACASLSRIDVEEGNPYFMSDGGVLYDKSRATLIACPGDKEGAFAVPSTVNAIAESAFYGCARLTAVSIPSTVREIGASAFRGCLRLTSITIPSGVTRIESDLFYGCTALSRVSLSSTVTDICSLAFFRCTSLAGITLPASLLHIYSSAFASCTSLASITLPGQLQVIGAHAFKDCQRLPYVVIPASVEQVGISAFARCTGLTSFMVHRSNTAFSAVDGVLFNQSQSVLVCYPAGRQGAYTMPSSVTEIAPYAFSQCTRLSQLTFSQSLTTIGNFAFYGCTGLTSLTLPGNVKKIGQGAFNNCTNLFMLTVYASAVPTFTAEAFSTATYTSAVLYVPQKSLAKYRSARLWKKFATILPILEIIDGQAEPAYAGMVTTLTVGLKTAETTLTGCEFDLSLPQGMSLVASVGGAGWSLPQDRVVGGSPMVTVTASDSETSHIKVDLAGASLIGNEGPLLMLRVMTDESMEPGEYAASLDACQLSYADGSTTVIEGGDCLFLIEKGQLGDVNLDGSVSVLDVTMTVGTILGTHFDNFVWPLADMNLDGQVTASDVTLIVGKVLGQ